MAESTELTLLSPDATRELGWRLASATLAAASRGVTIFLEGDLGAGKTTLARGFLQGLGHGGRVPSPTYTLVEPYEVAGLRVFHIDLYRIRAANELADLGLEDLLAADAVALVEWPDHGAGRLPTPDIVVQLRVLPAGRHARLTARSPAGRDILTIGGFAPDGLDRAVG